MTGRTQVALARSAIYRLLSMVFLREPTASFLAGLAGERVVGLLAKAGGPWMANLPNMDLASLADELATEYTRLFVGPGYHLYPYESMWVAAGSAGSPGPEAQLYGEPAVAVMEFYRRADIVPSLVVRELPDHAGVELECMSHLTDREARCWERGNVEGALSSLALQQTFLGKHLLTWLPRFARGVGMFGAHPFYDAFASVSSRFVRLDRRTVDDFLRDRPTREEETSEPCQTATGVRPHPRG